MNLQSILLVTAILFLVLFALLKFFFDRKITAGQTLFWLVLLVGAEVLVVFPSFVDRLSGLWGNLWPVSWITFVAIVAVVFYLLYLTVRLNGYSRMAELARSMAHLERRLRETEARCRELARGRAPSE